MDCSMAASRSCISPRSCCASRARVVRLLPSRHRATCTHLAGPLDEGTVEDGIVTCPWHGSRFCIYDGSVVNGPAVYAEPTFAVRVRNGKIELRRLDHA